MILWLVSVAFSMLGLICLLFAVSGAGTFLWWVLTVFFFLGSFSIARTR